MKSDKVIERVHIVANSLLLCKTSPWNFDCFHPGNINATPITNSINMRLQRFVDEF